MHIPENLGKTESRPEQLENDYPSLLSGPLLSWTPKDTRDLNPLSTDHHHRSIIVYQLPKFVISKNFFQLNTIDIVQTFITCLARSIINNIHRWCQHVKVINEATMVTVRNNNLRISRIKKLRILGKLSKFNVQYSYIYTWSKSIYENAISLKSEPK